MRTRPILMYHSIAEGPDPLQIQVTPRRFHQQLTTLKRLGYAGVSIERLLREPHEGSRQVGLTFDDGYADFACHAAPILAEFGFSATIFVVAGHVNGTNGWDRPPHRKIMSESDMREMRQEGHEIASHGVHHLAMGRISPAEVELELQESKRLLEGMINAPVTGFCYPYGALSSDAVSAAARYYDYACAVSSPEPSNRWAMPRFFVGEEDGPLRLTTKLMVRRARERVHRGVL